MTEQQPQPPRGSASQRARELIDQGYDTKDIRNMLQSEGLHLSDRNIRQLRRNMFPEERPKTRRQLAQEAREKRIEEARSQGLTNQQIADQEGMHERAVRGLRARLTRRPKNGKNGNGNNHPR